MKGSIGCKMVFVDIFFAIAALEIYGCFRAIITLYYWL